MSDCPTITFTPEKLKAFKALYETTQPKKTFMFEGREVLKEYAKYVIEHLETQFKKGS
jgi:hypothetical protein